MCTGTSYRLRPAEPRDVDTILELARSWSLDDPTHGNTEEGGFLVSGFTRPDYEDYCQRADHFYVIEGDRQIDGYVLAYSSELIQPSEWLNTQLKARYEPFVLIKQACLRKEKTSLGLGRHLYRHVFQNSPERATFAAIVLEPPNPRSVRFHDKAGFHKLLEMTPPDGRPRGIWRRAAEGTETDD